MVILVFNEGVKNTATISRANLEKLPKTAGVYLFYKKNTTPIYIGKAVNIKSRVKNHFQQPSYRDNLFIKKVETIGFIETDSEIEALVLEANLIKKNQPKFNVVWRADKNYFYVAISKGEKSVVYITHQKKDSKTNYIGPFVEGAALKKTLKYLRRIFPYYITSKHPKNACTWCHLGLCPGPNPNLQEYKKNIKKLMLILQGKRKTVLYSLKREMQTLSKMNKFEEAGKIRDRINALQQVMLHTKVIENSRIEHDGWGKTQRMLQSMLNVKKIISRVECYDISNIQGKYATGSMVVFTDGAPDKSQYKKFKINMKNEPNDVAMLKEVLTRRLAHPGWKYPEVMLIDGGIAQLNVAIKAKNLGLGSVQNKKIKIISIAKGRRELFIENKKNPVPLKNLPQEIYNLILHLDDEAHRFAITYHKKLRKKALLDI